MSDDDKTDVYNYAFDEKLKIITYSSCDSNKKAVAIAKFKLQDIFLHKGENDIHEYKIYWDGVTLDLALKYNAITVKKDDKILVPLNTLGSFIQVECATLPNKGYPPDPISKKYEIDRFVLWIIIFIICVMLFFSIFLTCII